jgi:hypothetical protein
VCSLAFARALSEFDIEGYKMYKDGYEHAAKEILETGILETAEHPLNE